MHVPWPMSALLCEGKVSVFFSVYLSCVCVLSCFSCVWLFETLWTVACQAPLSMGFLRQEYWSGLSCPLPGDLPHPGIEPVSLMSPTLASGFFTTSATGKPCFSGKGTNPIGGPTLMTLFKPNYCPKAMIASHWGVGPQHIAETHSLPDSQHAL